MLKVLLTTTALVVAGSNTGFAASTEKGGQASITMIEANSLEEGTVTGYLASNLIGHGVYSSGTADEERVGDVNDVVIGSDGAVEAVIVGVGGFLGIGEKDVAIDFDRLTMRAESNDSYKVLASVTKEELENATNFDTHDETSAVSETTTDKPQEPKVVETAATDTTAEPARDANTQQTAQTPQDHKDAPASAMMPDTTTWMEGKTKVDSGTLTAEKFLGARVHDANYDDVGEIGDMVMTTDGNIDAAIVDVGGFLGIGEKPVAVGFDQIEVYKDEPGNIYIVTTFTEEELESVQAYEPGTYKDSRDTMRLGSQS